jgi:hypothetical protein
VLGDEEVQNLMLQLEERMHAIASDTGVVWSANEATGGFRCPVV